MIGESPAPHAYQPQRRDKCDSRLAVSWVFILAWGQRVRADEQVRRAIGGVCGVFDEQRLVA
jgi:hypothetical protein